MPCYARQRPLEKLVWTRLLFLRMSIHIQKNNLITLLILEILDFKNPAICLIGREDLGQLLKNKNFSRHGACDGRSRMIKNFKIYQNHTTPPPAFTQEAGSRFHFTPVDTKTCPFYSCCGKDIFRTHLQDLTTITFVC